MELLLTKIFWSNFILFIWFNTNTFIHYFPNYKKSIEYIKYREINNEISFPDFLNLKYPSFINSLLSCPPCLLFWIVIIILILFGISSFPIVYIMSYVMYRILNKYIYK